MYFIKTRKIVEKQLKKWVGLLRIWVAPKTEKYKTIPLKVSILYPLKSGWV